MPPHPLRTKPAHKAPRARPDPMDQAAQGKAQDDPAKDDPMAPLAAQAAQAAQADQAAPADLVAQVALVAVVAPARSSRPSMPIAMA
ncbi:MAG: hypothetical protein RI963_3570 [Planctomycetota bacterium]